MFTKGFGGWLRQSARQEGQALVLFSAGLAGFVGVVGMAIDIGHVMFTKTDLQRTADAAVTAAAQDLPNTSNASTTATSFVASNAAESGTSHTTVFSATYAANDTVRVTVTRTVNHWFLRVVGLNTTNVSASAKARSGQYAGGAKLLPWGFIASNNNNSTLLQNPCYLGQSGGVPQFQQNVSCTLKQGAGTNAGGDFGALALDGAGGSTYRAAIMNGSTTRYKAGDQVDAQTGAVAGPTDQGIEDRFSRAAPAGCPGNARANVLVTGADGRTKIRQGCEQSARVIVIPVVDQIDNSSANAPKSTILGFAYMFLTGTSNSGGHKQVHGEFIKFVTELPNGVYEGFQGDGPKVVKFIE